MALALVVGVAGALGAVSRWLVDGAVQDRTSGLFPFGTATVNVIGSFVIGVVAALTMRAVASAGVDAVVGGGFCGGLTTWSTASWETVRLAEEGAGGLAVRYLLISISASMLAAAMGLALGFL